MRSSAEDTSPSVYLRSHDNLLELIRRFVRSQAEHTSPSVYLLMSYENLLELIRLSVHFRAGHTFLSEYIFLTRLNSLGDNSRKKKKSEPAVQTFWQGNNILHNVTCDCLSFSS